MGQSQKIFAAATSSVTRGQERVEHSGATADVAPIQSLSGASSRPVATVGANAPNSEYTALPPWEFDPGLIAVVQEPLARRYRCVPVAARGSRVLVATDRTFDHDTLRLLEFAVGRPVATISAPAEDVELAFLRLYHGHELANEYLSGVQLPPNAPRILFPKPPGFLTSGPGDEWHATWSHLFRVLLADALECGASSVALEVVQGILRVEHGTGVASKNSFSLPAWLAPHLFYWWRQATGNSERIAIPLIFSSQRFTLIGELSWESRSLHLAFRTPTLRSPDPRNAQFGPFLSDTQRCPNCLKSLRGHEVLCPECHLLLRRLCRRCGTRLQCGQRHCPCCGTAATPVPAAKTAVPPAPAGSPLRNQPVGAPPTPLHVLVVDDQHHMRHAMVAALRGLPLRVSAVADGEAAIDLARRDPPQLFVLDMVMPGMDGPALLQHFRSCIRTAFVPAIAVTVLNPNEDQVQRVLGPEDCCLQKPFAPASLARLVTHAARRTYGRVLEAAISARDSTRRAREHKGLK